MNKTGFVAPPCITFAAKYIDHDLLKTYFHKLAQILIAQASDNFELPHHSIVFMFE